MSNTRADHNRNKYQAKNRLKMLLYLLFNDIKLYTPKVTSTPGVPVNISLHVSGHSVATVLAALAFLVLVAGLITEGKHAFRAFGCRWDPALMEKENINVLEAKSERMAIWRFGVPLAVVYCAALYYLLGHLDWNTFLALGGLAFVTMPLRRLHGMVVSRGIYRLTRPTQFTLGHVLGVYYVKVWTPSHKVWLKYRWQWVNPVIAALLLLLPWIGMAIAWFLFWPLTGLIAIFMSIGNSSVGVQEPSGYATPAWRD